MYYLQFWGEILFIQLCYLQLSEFYFFLPYTSLFFVLWHNLGSELRWGAGRKQYVGKYVGY